LSLEGFRLIQPPVNAAPPQPGKNGFVKPLMIGCGVLFVALLVVGSVGAWLTMRMVGGAVHRAADAAQVAEGAAKAAEGAGAEAGASPDPAHEAAAGVAALKALVGGGKGHVETLSRAELKTVLPAGVGSLPRTASESNSGSVSGISGTSASATYGGGNGTVSVDVTDAANMAGLTTLMDFAMNIESEDDEGYQKSVQLGDVKVHEKWEKDGKHAELIGIVGGRFVVTVTGSGVDMSVDEAAFQAVDLAKLASVAATPK
jgi:hypothetical protein